ncbi:DNA-binding transcriptional LysR family regulator [Umezawaea tangerina]|uniref:DNA-binding transcriptional LysR family regulator n=1 Tax=Umezawaea tangerina TaxID=84725 RepID=A0A2T0SZH7_9PSEU|nr:DNA-binding transcriptional LysR family regulator [Umezawaea tangerina]
MELRALRYFVTVAEELHFGRAAQRLDIVQSAVSQQIARLERELGVVLLDRSPRHVRLTEAGVRVLEAARETLAVAARVRVVAGESAARVRIGVASGFTNRLERGVARMREAERPAEPVLVDLPVPARLDAVRDGELDLALVRGQVTTAGVRAVRVWSEALWVAVSETHPAADRPAVVLADLDRTAVRLPSRDVDPPLHDAIVSALRQAGVGPLTGPSGGTPVNVLIEVGADPRAWTLLPAEQLAGLVSRRVRALPVDPPLSVDGHVVTSLTTPESCADSYARAFADHATTPE